MKFALVIKFIHLKRLQINIGYGWSNRNIDISVLNKKMINN